MEINELRIGNWVKPNLPKYNVGFIRVNRIDDDDCVATINSYDSIEDFSPIPLTEEILVKCGFEEKREDVGGRYEEVTFYSNGIQMFRYTPIIAPYGWVLIIEGCRFLRDYLCVHQLQNLYYSLNGKELEIKL